MITVANKPGVPRGVYRCVYCSEESQKENTEDVMGAGGDFLSE